MKKLSVSAKLLLALNVAVLTAIVVGGGLWTYLERNAFSSLPVYTPFFFAVYLGGLVLFLLDAVWGIVYVLRDFRAKPRKTAKVLLAVHAAALLAAAGTAVHCLLTTPDGETGAFLYVGAFALSLFALDGALWLVRLLREGTHPACRFAKGMLVWNLPILLAVAVYAVREVVRFGIIGYITVYPFLLPLLAVDGVIWLLWRSRRAKASPDAENAVRA